ncbi:hypothetical protein E4U55_007129 [Claviceps digitariae]|nr:hypothetical protein E4U55_007129 [Claviceps digitariae]
MSYRDRHPCSHEDVTSWQCGDQETRVIVNSDDTFTLSTPFEDSTIFISCTSGLDSQMIIEHA